MQEGGGRMSEERKAAERTGLRLAGLLLLTAAVIWVLPEVWDKLSPFIISIPLAAAIQPVIRFMQKKLKMKRSPASLIPVILLLRSRMRIRKKRRLKSLILLRNILLFLLYP